MTKEEILVIVAAVVLFVLINVIMWSVIAAKNKRARKKELAQLEAEARSVHPAVLPDTPPVKFNIIESIVIVNTDETI